MNYGSLLLFPGILPNLQPMDEDDKRWRFLEEISKPFNTLLHDSFPELEEEALIKTSDIGELGDFNCQNVLTIWPKLSKSPDLRAKYPLIRVPKDIGEVIKKKLRTYAIGMIDKEHSVQDVGFLPLSLSRSWLVKSIHMMLKDGIKTWAPKLPVERVVVEFPALNEENRVGVSRREAIKVTLANMLQYSKVDRRHIDKPKDVTVELWSWGRHILNSSVLIEDRGTHVVINEQTVPFILTKKDFYRSCIDLNALWEVSTSLKTVDWVVFVAPVRQQEYIEMCFTAAKHEKWIVTDEKVKWNPALANEYPVATYAGYRTCNTEQEELVTLLGEVESHCKLVALGGDAKYLKYKAHDVFRCVLLYTYLKNHRLADCSFNLNEMVGGEGDTFVYLLHSLAKIRKVADKFREEIKELKKASDLILKSYEEWEEGKKERALVFHLLNFTEVLEDSCLSILSHMICEYLYELTNHFNRYFDFVSKVDVEETSKLLLCAATEVVMDKCFQLLGIDNKSPCWDDGLLQTSTFSAEVAVEPDYKKQKIVDITLQEQKFKDRFITPSFVSGPRDPARYSRFELFKFRIVVKEPVDCIFEEGNLFGAISVSDKYGFRPDGGTHLFEPDFPYVHSFLFEWHNAIEMYNGRYEYFGNLSSRHSVPFSSAVEIFAQLYATPKLKNACFQVSNLKYKIDLSDFWGENLNSMCGSLIADEEDAIIEMYYIAMKEAVDTTLEVKFNGEVHEDVYGIISAYYGGTFSYDGCDRSACYTASLFNSKFENGTLSLSKSNLAVPKGASLIISARLVDRKTNEYFFFNDSEFLPGSTSRSTMVGFRGATCSLELTVIWKSEAQ